MSTYPQYPQPVLAQSNGRKWYLEVTIPGILQINGPITDGHPLSHREATLINTTRTMAYRLSLSDDEDPLLLANPLPAAFGNREGLSVWAPNGREWEIYIDNDEIAYVRAIGSSWPRAKSPVLKDANNIAWRLTVANTGIYSVGSDPNERTFQSLVLRSRDDTAHYRVSVSTSGVLSLSDAEPAGADLTLTNHFPNTGGAWSRILGFTATAKATAQHVEGDTGVGSAFYINTAVPDSADYDVEADVYEVTSSARLPGVIGRMRATLPAHGYVAYWYGVSEEWRLAILNEGVEAILGTYSGDSPKETMRTVKLEMRADALKVFIDGVERISVTDSVVTDAGFSGLVLRANSTIDNFVARNSDGNAFVSDDFIPRSKLAASATFYEAELTSPDGNKWAIYVDHVGSEPRIYISDVIEEAENERDVWPLLMGKDNKTLYVLDSRFKLPPGVRRGR